MNALIEHVDPLARLPVNDVTKLILQLDIITPPERLFRDRFHVATITFHYIEKSLDTGVQSRVRRVRIYL